MSRAYSTAALATALLQPAYRSVVGGSRLALALGLCLSVMLVTGRPSRAATFTWTQAAGGNWSTAGNWDVQPTFPGSGTDVLLFGTGGTYTSNFDAAFGVGAYSLNQLNFANPSGTVTVSAAAGNSFLFTGAVPTINLTGAGSAIVSAPMTLGAPTTFRNSGTGSLAVSGNIDFGGNTLVVTGPGNTTLGGALGNAGAGGLTKHGLGTLSITGVGGAATYTGTTTVGAGTMALSYANVASNLLSSSSALTLGGAGGGAVPGGSGTLTLTSGATASSQVFGGAFTINTGGGTVALSNAGGGTMSLTLPDTWTRAIPTLTVGGGTVNFVVPAGTSISSNPALSSGIIGGYATIGTGPSPTGWATVTGGLIAPFTGYVNDTWAAGNNTTVTASTTAAGANTNTLRFNAPGAFTVTFSAAHTIGSTTAATPPGGILVTSNVGAGNVSTITGSTLKAALTNNDLIINQYNPHVAGTNAGAAGSGDLVIGSQLLINGTGGLTVSGNGYVVLTSTAATTLATGAWTINNGAAVVATGANNISFGAAALTFPFVLNGGRLSMQATGGANIQVSSTHAIVVNQDSTIGLEQGTSASSNFLVGANAASTTAGKEIQLNNSSTITFDNLTGTTDNIRVNKSIINGTNADGTPSVGSVNIVHGLTLLNPSNDPAVGTPTPNTFTGPVKVFNSGVVGATAALVNFTWATAIPGQLILGEAATNTKGQFNLSGYPFVINTTANLDTRGTGINTINGNSAGSLITFAPTAGTYTFTGSLTGGANLNVQTTTTTGNNVVLNMIDTAASVANLNSSTSGTGTVTINLINATGTTFTVAPATPSTFGGLIASPTGTGNVTMNGASSLTLTQANTYNGFTRIDNGTLILGVNNALPVTTALRIGNASANITSLDLHGFNQSVAGLQANASSTLASVISIFNDSGAGTSTLTITGGTNLYGGATFAGSSVNLKDSNLTPGGIVAVALTGGTTTFSGLGTFNYSGGTTISGATTTLNVAGDTYLGAPAGSLTLSNGGTLQFAAAGGITVGSGRAVTLGGAAGGVFDTNGGNDTIAGNITGTTLVKTGAGTLTLTPAASNTYSGATIIQNGTLVLGSGTALPAGTSVQMGTGPNNTTLDLKGQSVTVSALGTTGSGTATILNNGGAASTLTFVGGTSTFPGVISSGGANPVNLTVATGSLTLVKGGLGTSATQTAIVNDGANLGVNVVTPGDVLTLGTLNVGSGAGISNLTFNLSGNPTTAPIAATNVAGSPAGTARINIFNGAPALTAPATFDLLTSVNPIANLGSFTLGQLPPRVSATLVTTSTKLQLNVASINTIKWTGGSATNPTFWDIGTVAGDGFTPLTGTPNWKQTPDGQVTVYTQSSVPGDTVTFDGTATGPKTADLRVALSPAAVTVDTSGGDYTFTSTTSGSLTGAMGLVKKNAGTLFITNPTANTYTGGTLVQGGTVQIGGTSAATPGPGSLPSTPAGSAATLSAGGTLAFNLNAPFVLSGFVTDDGTGVVNVLGNTLTLTNTANNWSTTNISPSATLFVGDGSSSGSLVGNANNASTLAFKPGLGGASYPVAIGGTGGVVQVLGTQVATLSGNITGSQALQVNDTSTAILTGATNSFTGGATINAGTTLQIGDGTLTGSLPAANIPSDNGTLVFRPGAGGITFANAIGGTGRVQALSNTTILTGNNTYTGITTVGVGATLQVGDGVTTGAIAGSITNNGTLVLNPASPGATYGSAIGGSGAVNLVTARTFTFTAASTYSGGTAVPVGTTVNYGVANALPNAGTLTVDGTVNLNSFAGSINVLAGAGTINLGTGTLTVNGTGTFNGVIIGAGTLLKSTTNTTLTLNANNLYTGQTQVNSAGSVLKLGVDNTLPVGTTLHFTTTTGVGTVVDLNGHNQRVAVLQDDTTTGSVSVTNSGATLATLTVSNPAVNFGNNISTGNAILADGTGPVALTVLTANQGLGGSNTYTGNTTLMGGGQINANFGTANTVKPFILSSSTNIHLGGGTFQVSAKNTAGQVNSQTVASLTLDSGANSMTGSTGSNNPTLTVNLNAINRPTAGTTLNFTLPTSTNPSPINTITPNVLFPGGAQTILGGYATVGNTTWAVSGTGASAGAISPLGTFDSSATFVAGGDQDAPVGTLQPAGSMAINSLRFNNAGAYTFTPTNTGDTLTVATGGILVTTTVGANAIAFDAPGGGAGVGVLTSANGQDLIVNQKNNTAGGTMTIGSKITGPIALTKTAAGALVLTNATNNYTGPTYVTGGTLSVSQIGIAGAGGTPSQLGASSNAASNLVLDQGNLTYTGPGETTDRLFTIGNFGTATIAASGTGPLVFSATGAIMFNSVSASTGVANQNAIPATLTLTGSNTGANVFSPLINDVATIVNTVVTTKVAKTGAGTWVLTNNNTYTGGTTLTAGTLGLGSSGAIGTAGTISFGGGTLQHSAANTIDYSPRFSTAAGQAYSVDTNGQNVTWATALTSSGGSLNKLGAGTLTLPTANTYTGPTTVTGGTLALTATGSIASTSITVGTAPGSTAVLDVSAVPGGLTIGAGRTLAGHGTVVGVVTVTAGGTVSPGTSPGTLTLGGGSSVSGTYLWELATAGTPDPSFTGGSTPASPQTNHDALAGTGALDLTGSTLNLVSLGTTTFDGSQPYSWKIATVAGSLTGAPTIGTVSGTDFLTVPSSNFSVINPGSGVVLLNYNPVPVPEPAFVVLACGVAAGVTWLRRRRPGAGNAPGGE